MAGIVSIITFYLIDEEIIGMLLSIIPILMGLVGLAMSYGFYNGVAMCWYMGFIISVFGILVGILIFPLGLVISLLFILIIYYMFTPEVKKFFGI